MLQAWTARDLNLWPFEDHCKGLTNQAFSLPHWPRTERFTHTSSRIDPRVTAGVSGLPINSGPGSALPTRSNLGSDRGEKQKTLYTPLGDGLLGTRFDEERSESR